MKRQEASFLACVRAAGDPTIEARLLAGYALVRLVLAGSADEQAPENTRAALRSLDETDFSDASAHLAALRGLATALAQQPINRRQLHASLVHYGEVLAREEHAGCADAVFSISERIWDDSCDEQLALQAFYRWALIMARGRMPLARCRELPFLLAMRARRARSDRFLGFARLLQVEVFLNRGVIPLASRAAQRLLRSDRARTFPELAAHAHIYLAALEGRSGSYDRVLEHASSALNLAGDFPVLRQNALNLLARALADLGRLDDAQRAYELAMVSDRSAVQTLIILGLMELSLLKDDLHRFDHLNARIEDGPFVPAHRTLHLQLSARRHTASGELAIARRLLERGRHLAQRHGLSWEYLGLDTELSRLGDASRHPPATRNDGSASVDLIVEELIALHANSAVELETMLR